MTPHKWLLAAARMVAAVALVAFGARSAIGAEVELLRVPNAGIQPQAVTDRQGTVHLLYFKGKAGGGDLFYTRQLSGQSAWSDALRVNTVPDTAIATGTIRGGQMSLGRDGWVHVVWNGSQRATNHRGVPFFYTRLGPAQTAFEPQRDLVNFAIGLDGGGSVTADSRGNVYAIWHGVGKGDSDSESDRRVFLSKSANDGKSFTRESAVSPDDAGVCACCGLRGLVDERGQLMILYRAVAQQTNRNSTLIRSIDAGQTFTLVHSHPWSVSTCPMSSSGLAATPAGILAAWETAGQVYAARFDETAGRLQEQFSPAGRNNKKHPVVVANAQGDRLFAWTEGTGWQRGGALAWQLLDRQGKPVGTSGRKDGIPVWSFAAVVARLDGTFMILY